MITIVCNLSILQAPLEKLNPRSACPERVLVSQKELEEYLPSVIGEVEPYLELSVTKEAVFQLMLASLRLIDTKEKIIIKEEYQDLSKIREQLKMVKYVTPSKTELEKTLEAMEQEVSSNLSNLKSIQEEEIYWKEQVVQAQEKLLARRKQLQELRSNEIQSKLIALQEAESEQKKIEVSEEIIRLLKQQTREIILNKQKRALDNSKTLKQLLIISQENAESVKALLMFE